MTPRISQLQKYGQYFLLFFLLFLPFILRTINPIRSPYYLLVLSDVGINVMLSLGLGIILGYAGLLNLGYVAFYGIGAYTLAILNFNHHLGFWTLLPICALVTGIFGLILGAPVLRVRGDYLAIITLGFGEITRIVLNNWDDLTHGPKGISVNTQPFPDFLGMDKLLLYYYLILCFIICTVLIISRLDNSRIGRAWIAIREDEIAAESMGVNVARLKLLAFAIGAVFAGITGAYFASRDGFVSPDSFGFMESVIIVTMVVLGGMGSIPGTILGAVLLTLLVALLRDYPMYRMLLFGALMVIIMIFRPQGLIGNPLRYWEFHPDTDRTRKQEDESLTDTQRK